MIHCEFICVAVGPTHDVEVLLFVLFWGAPAAARSIQEIIPDETILEGVARGLRQRVIAPRRSAISAVIEERQRHPHHRDVTGGNFRAPHAIALRIRTHEHVEMLVFTFEK